MQTAGGIKNRKRRQQKLEDILSQTEKEVKVSAIQSINIEDFRSMISTLDGQTTSLIIQTTKESLENHFKIFDNLSKDEYDNYFTDILSYRELIRQYRIILNSNLLVNDLQKPILDIIKIYDKKINKIISTVISTRKNKRIVENYNNQNLIAIATLNVKQKILNYATPEDTTALENLKRILNSLVIGLKSRMEDISRSDVIKMEIDNKLYIKLPSPSKFFERSVNFKVNNDTAEHQISSIQDFYLFLYSIKNTINSMLNVKRNYTKVQLTRKDRISRFNPQEWNKMIKTLNEIVDTSANEMANILMKNYVKLIDENKNKPDLYSFWLNPYIKQNNDFIYVYNIIDEIGFDIIRTYSSNFKGGYELLVNSLYSVLNNNILTLLDDNRPSKIILMNVVQRLFEIEKKMDTTFIAIKHEFANNSLTSNIIAEEQLKNSTIDKLLSENAPTKKSLEAVNMTLDDILNSITIKPSIEIQEKIKTDDKQEYDNYIKTLKDDNKYKTLINNVIKYYYKKYGTKLKLAFYQNMHKPVFQKRLLMHLSGFFKIYGNVYGFYKRDFFTDLTQQNNYFSLWQVSRVDLGELILAYYNFLLIVINQGFTFFENERLLIRNNITNDEKIIVDSYFSKVILAYKNVLAQNKKVEVILDKNTGECQHIEIEEELNRVYDLLEEDPDNETLKENINALLIKKEECTMSTDSAIICKHCNTKLDVIISSEPTTFENATELVAEQQKEIMFDIRQTVEDSSNDFNNKIVMNYLNLYINVLNISKVQEVSEFSDEATISNNRVKEIQEFINKIIKNNDKYIFNNARSFFIKKSSVPADSMKLQLIHDCIKFLVILFLLYDVGDKLDKDNLPCNQNGQNSILYIQCLFQHIQSMQVYINKALLNNEVRLNYLIRVYNLSIDLLRSSHNIAYEKDNTNITSESIESIDETRLIIISQEFGLKDIKRSNIKNEIKKVKEKKYELPLNLNALHTKMINTINNSYQKFLLKVNTAVFDSKTIDFENVLGHFILLNEKKENLRIKTKQNNLDINLIKNNLATLETKINESLVPSKTLQLQQEKEALIRVIKKYEEDNVVIQGQDDILNENSNFIENNQHIIDSYKLNSDDKINIINLHQNIIYKSRNENTNETNPYIMEYNKSHENFKLFEKLKETFPNLDNRLMQKYIYTMFERRKTLLEETLENLNFYRQVAKLEPFLHKKGVLSNIVVASDKRIFIYKSDLGTVSMDYSFMKSFRDNLNVNTLNLSYYIMNSILNSDIFKNFARLVSTHEFMNENVLEQITEEINSYQNIIKYFEMVKDTVYLCPACDKSNTNNINIKLHLAKHHISTNDNLQIIRPIEYMQEMKWINGKSHFTRGYICPYCPYRDNISNVYKHIKDVHMDLKNSREVFEESNKRRYYAHLEKLYNDNRTLDDAKLAPGEIHYHENINILKSAKKLDNLEDMAKYYILFCDKNVDKFTTMRHIYKNGICLFCNRSVSRVHQDAKQTDKKYIVDLVKSVEKRLKDLNKKYCLLNEFSKINTTEPCIQKRKMVSALLNGKDTVLLNNLLAPSVSWELSRELDHIPFIVAKHLTDIVEKYKHHVRDYYNGDSFYGMVSLDEVDSIYKMVSNNDTNYYRVYDKNYLKDVSLPYKNLSKETKDFIFYHKDILELEKKILEFQKEKGKIDYIIYNEKINKMIKDMRDEISNRASKYLNDTSTNSSIEAFATDITTVLNRSDFDAYTDILNKLNDQFVNVSFSDDYIKDIMNRMPLNKTLNDQFINDTAERIKNTDGKITKLDKEYKDNIRQTSQWRYIQSLLSLPKDILIQLYMLTKGHKNTYRSIHYLLSQKEKKTK